MKVKEPLFDYISPDIEYSIKDGDSLTVLKTYKSGKFDLIITSPPYNIGKSYETKTSIENYLTTQEEIINELTRVLSDKGSICWQVGNYVNKGEVFPLDVYYYQIFKKLGLKLRNRIIWHFGHGLHASNRFSGRYETILWFTKTDNYIFNLDDVRVPSKYPGKRHFKGPNKGQLSGNPNGKNPSDIWEIVVKDWENELWNIPNVKSNHPEKTGHPCQYPIELVERCVLALTNKNSWILDPFSGAGSAASSVVPSAAISSCSFDAWILHCAAMFFALILKASALGESTLEIIIGLPRSEPDMIPAFNGISPKNGILNCSLIFKPPPSPKM